MDIASSDRHVINTGNAANRVGGWKFQWGWGWGLVGWGVGVVGWGEYLRLHFVTTSFPDMESVLFSGSEVVIHVLR